MKVKTNLRAGATKQKRGTSTDSTSVESVEVVSVPVTRCAGI
jgi:hypothetical protein